MTICDIYDALVASDRPYKPTISADKALGIIETQVRAGKLDVNFFRVFVDAKLFNTSRVSGRTRITVGAV